VFIRSLETAEVKKVTIRSQNKAARNDMGCDDGRPLPHKNQCGT